MWWASAYDIAQGKARDKGSERVKSLEAEVLQLRADLKATQERLVNVTAGVEFDDGEEE